MVKLSLIPGRGGLHPRFESLVRSNYETLFRAAYRFTQSEEDAEDLVQETLVRAYANVEKVVGLESPRMWLLCVVRRLFIDQTRRYDRHNVGPLEEASERAISSQEPGPAELTEAEMITKRIEASWRRLGRDESSLLALHDIEGYSLSELQEITGLKIGTIKSRLHRARVKLGRLLRSQGGFEDIDSVGGANS